jgi:hypothetical protein
VQAAPRPRADYQDYIKHFMKYVSCFASHSLLHTIVIHVVFSMSGFAARDVTTGVSFTYEFALASDSPLSIRDDIIALGWVVRAKDVIIEAKSGETVDEKYKEMSDDGTKQESVLKRIARRERAL